ncbi:hypothetical protein D3C77_687770 [compost metagenome]
MVNKGFSPAKGSPRKPFSMAAAPGFRPPVQAGILPSAFAAFSPPNGVRVAPSMSASCGETAAIVWLAMRLSARLPMIRIFLFFILLSSVIGYQKFTPRLSAT